MVKVNDPDGELTARERARLAKQAVTGEPFDYGDRMFPTFDSGKVFDSGYGLEGTPAEIKKMLGRSGQARSVEQVLTQPLRSAEVTIKAGEGDSGEAALCTTQLMDNDLLNRVVDQATAAVAYRHAFFEKEWELDGLGLRLKDLHWRPPASCEVAWDPTTGRQEGFRQKASGLDSLMGQKSRMFANASGQVGYVDIPRVRAWVYTHGSHREPVRGLSDLDVCHWIWQTQQKILFLLCQFLEGQSLPKIGVFGDSFEQAKQNAEAIADARASGVIAMEGRTDPTLPVFQVMESAGQGAAQFIAAINYFDSMMTKSVLASFTDLASSVGGTSGGLLGGGLSADQSKFFLDSRQAVANDLANQAAEGILKPLCIYNFGADAVVPKIAIGPLSEVDMARSLDLLGKIVTAPEVHAPEAFVGELINKTSRYLGLDEETVKDAVDSYVTKMKDVPTARELAAKNADSAEKTAEATRLKHTVDASTDMVGRAKAGQSPKDAAQAVRSTTPRTKRAA